MKSRGEEKTGRTVTVINLQPKEQSESENCIEITEAVKVDEKNWENWIVINLKIKMSLFLRFHANHPAFKTIHQSEERQNTDRVNKQCKCSVESQRAAVISLFFSILNTAQFCFFLVSANFGFYYAEYEQTETRGNMTKQDKRISTEPLALILPHRNMKSGVIQRLRSACCI